MNEPKLGWLGQIAYKEMTEKLSGLQKAICIVVGIGQFYSAEVNNIEIVLFIYIYNKLVMVVNEETFILSVKEMITCQAYVDYKIFPQELLNYLFGLLYLGVFLEMIPPTIFFLLLL